MDTSQMLLTAVTIIGVVIICLLAVVPTVIELPARTHTRHVRHHGLSWRHHPRGNAGH